MSYINTIVNNGNSFLLQKAIYKEFRIIGIERVKVDIVSNFPP